MPPRHPRILRYVAVDDLCLERLTCEGGIPVGRVTVLLNFVDLERFRPRTPLPPRPARALVFSNSASEATYLPAVREACARQGVTLDAVGAACGRPCDRPESLLGDYDLVFAKARAAQEALATGCAVVLCDAVGSGPLVTVADFSRMRRLNFGIRCLNRPPSADVLAGEIARYTADDAAEVCRRFRAEAPLDQAIDRIEAIYRDTLAEHVAHPPYDPMEEATAAATYLQQVSPVFERCSAALQQQLALAREKADRWQGERDRVYRRGEQAVAQERRLRERLTLELNEIRNSLTVRLRERLGRAWWLALPAKTLLRGSRACWRGGKRIASLITRPPTPFVE